MRTLLLLIACGLTFTTLSGQAPGAAPASQSTPSAALGGPRISFETLVYDFGRVSSGEIARHDFIFTNTGTARLEVTDVHPGCGCTTAGAWDKSVEPGKTGKIPLQFNSSGYGGMVSKSATVTCNDPDHPSLTLQLNGTVWKPIELTPSMAVFNVPSDNQRSETKIIKILNHTDQPLTISDLQCPNKEFQVELKTVSPGKEFEVLITSRPPFEIGNVMAPITAKTSYTPIPLLAMNAYLMVQPPILVAPNQLIIPAGPLTNSSPYIVTIRSQNTNRLELSDAKVTVPGVEVQIKEVQPGRIADLSVTFPTGFQLKTGERAAITVRTSHPKFPLITVPIVQAPSLSRAPEARPQSVVPHIRSLSGRVLKSEPDTK